MFYKSISRRATFAATAIVVAASALSGCDEHSAAVPPPHANDVQAAGEPAQNEDAGQGNGYAYHIRYPQLPADARALVDALHAYAAAQKKALLDARSAVRTPNTPPYRLDLEFTVTRRTSDFISVSASGSADTGGAHPLPLLASFNLHTSDGKVMALTDLFADTDAALKALSEEARRQLAGRFEAKLREATPEKDLADALKHMREWVERGTEPKPENFAVFLVDGIDAKAIGLELVFPPYQVAAYADGAQQVEVPAKVFYSLLKPEYRDAFQIDTAANKIAPGTR